MNLDKINGIYTIPRDKHRSKRRGSSIKLPIIHTGFISYGFDITLFKSWIYDETLLSFSGINKLFGISRIFHQEDFPFFRKYCNSFLIGQKTVIDNINESHFIIYSYYDLMGREFRLPYKNKFEFDIPIHVKITELENAISWKLDQNGNFIRIIQQLGIHNPKIGYFLYPYFGGKSTAPHEMKLEISNFKAI